MTQTNELHKVLEDVHGLSTDVDPNKSWVYVVVTCSEVAHLIESLEHSYMSHLQNIWSQDSFMSQVSFM